MPDIVVCLLLFLSGASNVLLFYERYVGGEVKAPRIPERVVELRTSFTPPQSSAFLPFLDSEVREGGKEGGVKALMDKKKGNIMLE